MRSPRSAARTVATSTGGNGNASQDPWTATVTFPTAGTAGFYCEVHGGDGGIGMSGIITDREHRRLARRSSIDPTTLAGAADEGASTTVPLSISTPAMPISTWTADTASTDCATPDIVPWLSLAPANGTVVAGDPPTIVDVTLDATDSDRPAFTTRTSASTVTMRRTIWSAYRWSSPSTSAQPTRSSSMGSIRDEESAMRGDPDVNAEQRPCRGRKVSEHAADCKPRRRTPVLDCCEHPPAAVRGTCACAFR